MERECRCILRRIKRHFDSCPFRPPLEDRAAQRLITLLLRDDFRNEVPASPDGKQALLDGEFTAVAAQVPIQIAEYAYNAANEYLSGNTDLGEKKVYLDSFLVTKEIAEETLNDWQ